MYYAYACNVMADGVHDHVPSPVMIRSLFPVTSVGQRSVDQYRVLGPTMDKT
jgi:hypothetical protein